MGVKGRKGVQDNSVFGPELSGDGVAVPEKGKTRHVGWRPFSQELGVSAR